MTTSPHSKPFQQATYVRRALYALKLQGSLGVVAAANGIDEYKLHNFARFGFVPDQAALLNNYQIKKLFAYLKEKESCLS